MRTLQIDKATPLLPPGMAAAAAKRGE